MYINSHSSVLNVICHYVVCISSIDATFWSSGQLSVILFKQNNFYIGKLWHFPLLFLSIDGSHQYENLLSTNLTQFYHPDCSVCVPLIASSKGYSKNEFLDNQQP